MYRSTWILKDIGINTPRSDWQFCLWCVHVKIVTVLFATYVDPFWFHTIIPSSSCSSYFIYSIFFLYIFIFLLTSRPVFSMHAKFSYLISFSNWRAVESRNLKVTFHGKRMEWMEKKKLFSVLNSICYIFSIHSYRLHSVNPVIFIGLFGKMCKLYAKH